MYYFLDSASSILKPSKFFLAYSPVLSLLSFSTTFLRIFHVDEGALAPATMSVIFLYVSTALVRPSHAVSDCITICLLYSLSNSLRELSPVMIIERLWCSASFDSDDKANV